MFLEQITRRQEALINMRKHAAEAVSPRLTKDGKTVGLKISEDMRKRLLEQSKRVGAKSYTQFVMMCVELGLDAVERSQ